jgi:hypothetical protein
MDLGFIFIFILIIIKKIQGKKILLPPPPPPPPSQKKKTYSQLHSIYKFFQFFFKNKLYKLQKSKKGWPWTYLTNPKP